MKIGVFHAGALGDCVLMLHMARAIRMAVCPPTGDGADVWLIARSPLARMAVGRSFVTFAADLDGPGWHRLFADAGVEGLPPQIEEAVRSFDLAVSFCGPPDRPPASHLRSVVPGPVVAVDPRVRPETIASQRHITRQWAGDLHRQGIDVSPPPSSVLIRLKGEREAPAVRQSPGHGPNPPRVLIHPGSGGRAKCWPIEGFELLATALQANGVDVAWMIGPVELDWHGPGFARRLARIAPVVYEEELEIAASHLGKAELFVGNDSGMSHLAAALGTPTIALFGPTDPTVWRPLGPCVITLRGGGKAADPFEGLEPADVERAAGSMLTSRRAASP